MESVTGWAVSAGSALLMIVVTGSWLASIRAQKSSPTISSRWFSLPAWAQIILGFAAIGLFIWFGSVLWNPLPLRLSEPVITVLRPIGLGIFLIGLVIALWARWALGGMYGVSTSFNAPLQAQHRLIQHGPYAVVRHPMYLGYWLVVAGVLLIYYTWTPLLLLIACVLSFYRRARREEKALAERFGPEWQAYVARSKFLIPYLY